MEQNLCRLLRLVSCMSLSTQLLALVHLLSRCYTPAAYPECRHQNTSYNCYLSYNRCARSGCHSWLPFITVVIPRPPPLYLHLHSQLMRGDEKLEHSSHECMTSGGCRRGGANHAKKKNTSWIICLSALPQFWTPDVSVVKTTHLEHQETHSQA